MFIGFYNGLIAPIEFDDCRETQIKNAMEQILDSVSDWAKEGNNKWWLIGGGIVTALLIIRYSKHAIPMILLLVAMIPIFINDKQGQSKYFTQITSGNATIDLP